MYDYTLASTYNLGSSAGLAGAPRLSRRKMGALQMPGMHDAMPAPRNPLNRQRVLRAAMALADENGIESLTMRRLGKAVGVEAMSVYNHVASKEDLLDGMIDVVFSEIELPSAGD